MTARILVLVALLAMNGCGPQVVVPPAPVVDAAAAERQTQAFVDAMKPARPGKPVVVVVARNKATETTDFLLSHAVLKLANVAEVRAVAPQRGPVYLYPALQVEVEQDFAAFDRAHPRGADYVVVPAMLYEKDQDPAVTGWLKAQAAKGARILGVCAGALVVADAGLLDGRRFATHWYFRKHVLKEHPQAQYVPHQRYVADRGVGTTTGVTASVPALLALVEAIGGRDKAQALAGELGVPSWTPVHDSTKFGLSAARMWDYVVTTAAFWRHQRWGVEVREGTDDVGLAFAADAWSRTGRVEVQAAADGPVKLRSGLMLAAQPLAADVPRVSLMPALKAVAQLDRTLCEIEARFGATPRERVMVELEYPVASAARCGSAG